MSAGAKLHKIADALKDVDLASTSAAEDFSGVLEGMTHLLEAVSDQLTKTAELAEQISALIVDRGADDNAAEVVGGLQSARRTMLELSFSLPGVPALRSTYLLEGDVHLQRLTITTAPPADTPLGWVLHVEPEFAPYDEDVDPWVVTVDGDRIALWDGETHAHWHAAQLDQDVHRVRVSPLGTWTARRLTVV